MKFGCCIQRADEIMLAKEAGCDHFEFSGAAVAAMSEDEFRALLYAANESGLPCCGFNSYCAGSPAIVGDACSPEETERYARLVCGRGERQGIRSVGIGAPKARRLPSGYDMAKADEQCADFLKITARVAAESGQLVLFEAVHDRLCNYATHTSDAAAMVKALDVDNIAIVLDFYHMSMMNESLDDAMAALPYLRHVHFSTACADLGRGFPQTEDSDEYRKIIAWLKAHGYGATVSIEPSGFNTDQAKGCIAMLKKIDRETEAQ